MVQRGHIYAIVDEVDSILIDEARTPLIISGPARNQAEWAPVSRPDCAHNVTFKARPDAKPVPSVAGRAFTGLRLHCKGANRTPPTRCPAF
jgi:hypothetical protein